MINIHIQNVKTHKALHSLKFISISIQIGIQVGVKDPIFLYGMELEGINKLGRGRFFVAYSMIGVMNEIGKEFEEY